MARVKKSFNEKHNSPFATNMRILMKERRITQAMLADEIGRTRQTVCQYVNGDSEPGYGTLAKIADFFSVSIDFLLGISPARSRSADEAYKQGWEDAYKRGWDDACNYTQSRYNALQDDVCRYIRERMEAVSACTH